MNVGFIDKIFKKEKIDYAQSFKEKIENKEVINDKENTKLEDFIEKWTDNDRDSNVMYAAVILAHKHAAYKNFSDFDFNEVKETINLLIEAADQLNPTNKKLERWYKNEAKKIQSQIYLFYGLNSSDWRVRKEAVENIDDQKRLSHIAKYDSNVSVRGAAVEKVSNQDVLADVALHEEHVGVRFEAVKRVKSRDVLYDVACNDSDEFTRKFAKDRLNEL